MRKAVPAKKNQRSLPIALPFLLICTLVFLAYSYLRPALHTGPTGTAGPVKVEERNYQQESDRAGDDL